MNRGQHILFGLVSGTVVASAIYDPASAMSSHPLIITGFSCIGSLIPDIDTPTSTFGEITEPIANMINRAVGHRTITHDILIMFPLFVLSIFLKNAIFFGIMLGIMGHLLLDSTTKQGICFNFFKNREALKNSGIEDDDDVKDEETLMWKAIGDAAKSHKLSGTIDSADLIRRQEKGRIYLLPRGLRIRSNGLLSGLYTLLMCIAVFYIVGFMCDRVFHIDIVSNIETILKMFHLLK